MAGLRIGLSGGGRDVDRIIEQAKEAEADGFTSLWYAGAIGGDPLVPMALAGRATAGIELGTSVLQTYTSHPVLMANRVIAVANAMSRPGLTLGIGPSHDMVIEKAYGLSYGHVGRHTEEYVRILAPLLRGEPVEFAGEEFRVNLGAPAAPVAPITLLIAALAPRLLRVAGEVADGTVLWMANAKAIDAHVAPRLHAAASGAGRPQPRIVAGLPVAVHDDEAEARELIAKQFAGYGTLPNYRRILDIGGAEGPADAALVGNEESVRAQVQSLFDAGATDLWAAPVVVGADRATSRARTRDLLRSLAAS